MAHVGVFWGLGFWVQTFRLSNTSLFVPLWGTEGTTSFAQIQKFCEQASEGGCLKPKTARAYEGGSHNEQPPNPIKQTHDLKPFSGLGFKRFRV